MPTLNERFVAGVTPPQQGDISPCYWFPFRKRRMLVETDGRSCRAPYESKPSLFVALQERCHYFGTLDTVPCYAVWLNDDYQPPPGMDFLPLPALFEKMEAPFYPLCDRAIQIVEWDRTHQYCSRCGAKTRLNAGERAKVCPRCDFTAFPVLNPAVIVLVEREDRILLARSPRFPAGMFSVLAGFVEPGESLEDAVRREVFEEVGVTIDKIRYFGSQSWPFPHSLMIAFTAEYKKGELKADEVEIEKAGWFRFDRLPEIPGPISIARQLIDFFVDKHHSGRRDND